MKAIDLHTHTNKSDGSCTPAQLVDEALRIQLAAIAVTDHDTVDGIDEAINAARGTSLEVVPGIEFSTIYQTQDVHMVGLFIDHHMSAFTGQLQAFVDSRVNRNRKMCQNLQGAGIDITYEKLRQAFPNAVITRAHYAKYLFEYGYVKSLPEAFDRYLGDHTKYFVPREKISPADAISLILKAGGIPILAHPTLYHLSDRRLDALVADCKDAGLAGIEAFYASYSAADERNMRRLAEKYDLLLSGGSDYHGANKPGLSLGTGYGRLFVPEEILQKQKAFLKARSNEVLS